MDGKQRLSSVHAFMKGQIPCYDKHGKEWSVVPISSGMASILTMPSRYYCDRVDDVTGDAIIQRKYQKKRRVWSDRNRQDFRNKSFVSYEFRDLTRVQEEDLFARVQKGESLIT